MERIVDIVIETLYYYMNMNLLVSHVDSTQTNGNTKSKIQRKKNYFYQSIKIC